MIIFRSLSYILSISLIVVMLSACAQPVPEQLVAEVEATPTPQEDITVITDENTLQLLFWSAPTILNPYLSVGLKDFNAARPVYEPLATFDAQGELVTILADNIPTIDNGLLAEDGLSVTWPLREDVDWSDGEPFTADDVVFTYEYIMNETIGTFASIAYQSVESVEALDEHTVQVTFTEPNGAWFVPFTGRYGLILPEHIFADYTGANFLDAPANTIPVGTGPYRVTKFSPQEIVLLRSSLVETNVIVYEENPEYYGEEPFFKRIVLQGGGTPELATNIMASGFGDYAYELGSDINQREQLEDAGLDVVFNEGSMIMVLEMNTTDPSAGSIYPDTQHPILSDKNVRDAINMAINRQEIADEVYGGLAEPISNILVLPQEFVSPNTTIEYDPDQARELLEAAGWIDSDGDGVREKDGRSLVLEHQAIIDPLNRQLQTIVQRNLADVGIDIQIEVIDAGIFFGGDQSQSETVEKFRADIQHWNTPMPGIDPVTYLGYWTENQIPTPENNWVGFNSARWYSEEFDELHAQALTEIDPEERRELVIRMNDILVEDNWVLPLVRIADAATKAPTLSNVEVTPWDADTWRIHTWMREQSASSPISEE